jgi:TatD DNase family protein
MIIDTHAHLDFLSENKLNEIQSNPKISLVISNSVNISSNKKNLEISNKYSKINWAAGLYPEDNLNQQEIEELKKLIEKNKDKVIAIGEIGLDKTETLAFEKQIDFFKQQLKLAKDLNIPAIIHTRKAEKEVINILEEFQYDKIVLHCFSGNFKLIQRAIDLNYYFSIPTNIVRAEHFQKMVKIIPKEKILTETDTPHLSPFKEKQNEPAFISESINKISEIWGISKEEVEKIIEDNFKNLFKTKN